MKSYGGDGWEVNIVKYSADEEERIVMWMENLVYFTKIGKI